MFKFLTTEQLCEMHKDLRKRIGRKNINLKARRFYELITAELLARNYKKEI